MSAEDVGSARRSVVAGTRGSDLAMWQTRHVLGLLRDRWPEIEWGYRVYSTHGDDDRLRSLAEIGGRGAFTETIEAAMARGEIDFAVHSLKDLPTESGEGFVVAAVVGPRNPGEVVVSRDGRSIADLPPAAIVGTSSLRRRAQLLSLRPDLSIRDIRGNVGTRVAKVRRGEYDATVLAAAGVERLGLQGEIAEMLSAEVMLPAPGQGAIAVQCRREDTDLIRLLVAIQDRRVRDCITAEREFLRALGGGCSAPVGALAEPIEGTTAYRLVGRVIAPDGSQVLQGEESGPDARELGMSLAKSLMGRGAGALLGTAAQTALHPLTGRRVVVTRRKEQSAELVQLLENAGATVQLLPTIVVLAVNDDSSIDEALDELAGFDWVLFTSRNGVEHFSAVAGGRAGWPSGFPGRVAAVGSSTAEALAGAGRPADFVAKLESARGLGEELPVEPGMKVLYPCADRHGRELEELLEQRKTRVVSLPVYRTEPLPIGRVEMEALEQGVDWVLFTSGSTVEGFLSSFENSHPGGHRGFEQVRYACIGTSTAKVAEERGLAPVVVAETHSSAGLVAAVIRATMEKRV